ncbi:hypothetical protein EU642_22175 [Salmonella enterica]|nr:hypothetical protein [Salmonella enterica]EAO0118562.1 hypothetical protein [Salmonella enterica]EAO3601666.1 hypothetical protein [Salmonella enterica]EAR6391560.1 hypothetical protein [Salmonella enterica]EAV1285324.1 hypothetical protein [Salmonella enterica]
MNTQIQVLNQANSPALPSNVNGGAVTIEAQRAVTEAQSKIQLAKMFPRNETDAFDKLMFACSHPGFAEEAFYSLPRGDKSISGPSIRLAEEIARLYGNFTYGHRELSRGNGKSEVEVFAWDVENNNYTSRQITVMHVMDTKSGGYALRSQADIDTRIANIASKQLRGRILSLIPKWMLSEAVGRCRQTLAGGQNAEERAQRVEALEARFATRGVRKDALEAYLGHPLKLITDEEIADLFGVYTAIKEGSPINEFFLVDEPKPEGAQRLEKAVAGNEKAAEDEKPKGRSRKVKETAAPAPQEAPEQPEATDATDGTDDENKTSGDSTGTVF